MAILLCFPFPPCLSKAVTFKSLYLPLSFVTLAPEGATKNPLLKYSKKGPCNYFPKTIFA